MTPRIAWLLLTFIPLALYSGMVNGTFLSLDESEILQGLDQFSRNIFNYFLPTGGVFHLYYRPVYGLSLLFDYLTWGTQASGFHLTNILLHVVNVLLVFGLALRLTGGRHGEVVAFLAALLFAVHPIHTEAVDWIAGRTDLLATLFSLMAFMTYLRFRDDPKWRYLFISAGCYLLGLFSKEVTVSVPLVILAYEWLRRDDISTSRLRLALGTAGAYGVTTACYFILRKAALSRGDLGVAKSVSAFDVSWVEQVRLILCAVGFYVKKLVLPFPLNFSGGVIDSTPYLVLGLMVFGVACVAVVRRTQGAFWYWWILLTLSPAVLVAITGVAWTSVAERYLYLPSVGFSILAVLVLSAMFSRLPRHQMMGLGTATLAVCAWFFVGTSLRNVVWQDPLLLWGDTVRKSPEFAMAHNEYGIALMYDMQYEEAKQEFEKAIELGYRAKPLENLALMASYIDHDHREAERLLTRAIDAGGQPGRLYARLATGYARQASDESIPNSEASLRKAIALYEEAYAHHGDPVALYRIGQLHIRLGEFEKARASFERAIEKGGPDDFFVAPSKAIVLKLSSQRG